MTNSPKNQPKSSGIKKIITGGIVAGALAMTWKVYLKTHSEEICTDNQYRILRILTECDKPEKVPHFPLSDQGILLSKDPEIAQIQKTYGINHRNVHVSKADQGNTNHTQKARQRHFLESSKWKTQIDEVFYNRKNPKGWLVDIYQKQGWKYDISNDLITKKQTLVTRDTAQIMDTIWSKFWENTNRKMHITNIREVNLKNYPKTMTMPAFQISKTHIIDKNGSRRSMMGKQLQILKEILVQADVENTIIFLEDEKNLSVYVTYVSQPIKQAFPKMNAIDKDFIRTPHEQRAPISAYLDQRGLPESSKIILSDIFAKAQIDYSKFSSSQKRVIEQNVIYFMKYVLHIESSDGQYVNNKNSTATWPFQILDGHDKKTGARVAAYRGTNHFTTYEVYQRTYMKYANNSKMPDPKAGGHPDFITQAYNSNGKISPNELNQEQNINLFLVGTFLGDDKTNAELLMKVALLGDTNAVETLYRKHHTNPDPSTEAMIKKTNLKFGNHFQKVL